MKRSLTRTLLIMMMMVIRGQAIRAQADPSAVSPDPAPARAASTSGSGWTGFYIGAHAGVSSGSSAWSAPQPGGVPNLSGSLNLFRPYDGFTGSGSQFGGLAAGYNYTLPFRVVMGVEAGV